MHWFRRRQRPHESDNPSRPHPFRETNDPGISSMGAATGPWGALGQVTAATSAAMRASRCAVPGCGKERHAAIHSLARE